MLKISFIYLIIGVVVFTAACDSPPSTWQFGGSASDGDTDTKPSPDCSSISEPPFTINELDGPRAYHDVAFTPDGYIIGATNNALFKAKYGEKPKIFVPNIAGVEGMDFLPNGDLIVMDGGKGRLARITPSGEVSTLASGIYAYGLFVGPKGQVYATGEGMVTRVDPKTGEKETLVKIEGYGDSDGDGDSDSDGDGDGDGDGDSDGDDDDDDEEDYEGSDEMPEDYAGLRTVNFNLDLSVMYISTVSAEGIIYAVDMDENLKPKGKPYIFVTGVKSPLNGQGWHDGLGVDKCGNLYVPDFASWSLYRITPDKKVTLLIEWWQSQNYEEETGGYGHGIRWGSGVGDWKSDAIYLPQPYDDLTVAEVLINVPARKWSWQK